MSPAEMAGLMAGIEKVAYSDSISTGQYTSSHLQPPPPQTPQDHKKRTRRRAAALAAGLAVGGAAVLGRRHIARGARAAADWAKGKPKVKGLLTQAKDQGQSETMKKIRNAKSWSELGLDKPRSSGNIGLGQAPVSGTPIGEHVKKQFADMGMSAPPMGHAGQHQQQTKRPSRLRQTGKAGIALGATAALTGVGLTRGAAKGFGKRVSRQESDETPGVASTRG